MAIQLRYRLGYKLGDNVIADPQFANVCGVSWTCEKDWNIVAGFQATFGPTGVANVRRALRQNNVLTQGQRYRVQIFRGGVQPPWIFLGDYRASSSNDGLTLPVNYSVDGTCLTANTDFCIYGDEGGGVPPPGFAVNSCYVYELNYNDPLLVEPAVSPSLTLSVSELIRAISLGFIDNIKFIGDGYDYFLDNYGQNKTPLKIEYNDGSGWLDLTEGDVYFTDRNINYEKKEITLSYEDKSVMNVMNKGKDSKIPFRIETGLYDPRIIDGAGGLLTYSLVNLHNPATGAYTDSAYIYRLFYALMIVVHEISELDIHIDASPLENMSDLGGAATTFLGIIDGAGLRLPGLFNRTYISFQEIIEEFYNIANIALVPRLVAGVKTLVMELRDNLIINSTLSFDNVFEIKEQRSPFNYKSFNFGYKRPDLNRTETGTQYVSVDEFFDSELDLASEWIQNGTIIWAVAAAGNTDYEDSFHLVEYWDNAGTWRSRIFAGNAYNGDIDVGDIANNFLDIMTGEYQILLASGDTIITGTAEYVRIFTFKYPLTINQFLILLNNPYTLVSINSTNIDLSTGLTINTEGYLLEVDYDILKNIASFKMLVQ